MSAMNYFCALLDFSVVDRGDISVSLSGRSNVIKAHPKVINFYSNMGATPPRESTAAAAQTSLGTVDASCGKAGGAHIQATPVVARVNPLFCDDE
jgi:hypothetical protein